MTSIPLLRAWRRRAIGLVVVVVAALVAVIMGWIA